MKVSLPRFDFVFSGIIILLNSSQLPKCQIWIIYEYVRHSSGKHYKKGEPLYYPKGEPDETCYFDLSPDYLSNSYQEKAPLLLSRFNDEEGRHIDLGSKLSSALLRIPLDQVQVVKRRDQFSVFIPRHQKAAGRLTEIFIGLQDTDELMAFAAYARDRVNPQLYVYALSIALLHRDDTKNLNVPSCIEVFPEKFVNSETVTNARETAEIFVNPNDRVPVEVPRDYTGNDSDSEHRLAYFREDLGINLHHWHWHLVYPFEGPDIVVRKERRGELFYYMHRQMLIRYNIERLCNNLNLTRRLLEWYEPIDEAYFPMLNTKVAGKAYPSRPVNMRMSNIDRPDLDLSYDIEDMRRFRDRIYEAIHSRKVIKVDGSEININNESGIDVLGNIIEASTLNPNADYYGSLGIHNMGHLALALIHDPQNKYMQTTGVMADTNTAMRDPVFYRWHAFIEDLFEEHKRTLPPYSVQNLTFQGIQVTGVELYTFDENRRRRKDNNVLNTFMMKSDINMSRGLDFTPRGAVLARITHLNNDEFAYTIRVTNTTGNLKYGTVRIFMTPVLGFGNFSIDLKEQRNLMIEMDRFVATLQPGSNVIVRQSTQSSVTIPFEQTFRDLNIRRPDRDHSDEFERFNYCGCGWPQHMLLPKGTKAGYPMILFVMVSDYEQDRIDRGNEQTGINGCRTGVAFCGLRDKLYPDRRPMGYPFDRSMRRGVDKIQTFLTPNMATAEITIIHSDVLREGNLVSDTSIPARELDVPSGVNNINTSNHNFASVNEMGWIG